MSRSFFVVGMTGVASNELALRGHFGEVKESVEEVRVTEQTLQIEPYGCAFASSEQLAELPFARIQAR